MRGVGIEINSFATKEGIPASMDGAIDSELNKFI